MRCSFVMNQSLQLDHLSFRTIGERIQEGYTTVIVPLGATEQHGPALPLLVDNEHGLHAALRAAQRLEKTLVGPVVTLGHSPEHAAFAGSVSVSKETLKGMLHDIAESHARSGFKLVYFWPAHGGNGPILKEVLPSLESRWPGCRVSGLRDVGRYVRHTWDKAPLERGISLSQSGSHAGEFETSMMLAMRPELVRMEKAEAGNPAPFDTIGDAMMREGMEAVSPNGVLGDQRGADAERGNFYLDTLADYLAAEVRKEL